MLSRADYMDEAMRWVQRFTRRTGMVGPEIPWLPIESETVKGLAYLVKDGHIIIDGGNCGMLAVKMGRQLIADLAMELIEMVETYG